MSEDLLMPHRPLSILETEIAIKLIKDQFEHQLAEKLHLYRVSAPLFVNRSTGLNDNLNGVEEPVSFRKDETHLEIVHSLAKWKRLALHRYGIPSGQGLYTDMNAIRKDETLDAIHSMYVDQWDWERIIERSERTVDTLHQIVRNIYDVLLAIDQLVVAHFPQLSSKLPPTIVFITTLDLEARYPDLSPKEREHAITKEHGAVFLQAIGDRHDGRAPDYDDWTLNGDILVWNEVLQQSLELSSMGIRVDRDSLLRQLKIRDALDRLTLPYHQLIMEEQLPFTIGGGIGQSRLCMFYLEKRHIGEVQSSFWPDDIMRQCEADGIFLL